MMGLLQPGVPGSHAPQGVVCIYIYAANLYPISPKSMLYTTIRPFIALKLQFCQETAKIHLLINLKIYFKFFERNDIW